MRFRLTSLTTKMAFTVFLLVILLMSVTAFTALFYFEKKIKDTITSSQFALLSALTNQIDERISDARSGLDSMATLVTPEMLADPAKVQNFLGLQKDNLHFFNNSLIVFDSSSKMVAATPADLNLIGKYFSFREYFQETLKTKKPYVSAPFTSIQTKSHPIIIFTSPVFDSEKKVIAIIGGSIDLSTQQYLKSLADLKPGRNGFISMYDSNRTVLIHPDKSRLLKEDPPGSNKLLDKALKGFEGTEETYTAAGLEVLMSVKSLQSTDWVVAVSSPLREAYAPIYTAREYFVWGGIFAALFSSAFVWLAMRFLTVPIKIFTRHIEELPAMNFSQKAIDIDSGDELETLARAFNRMLAELEKQGKELKEQKDFAENLVLHSSLATFVIDTSHRVLIWNRACEELTGLSDTGKGSDQQMEAFYGQKRPSLADLIIDGKYRDIPNWYSKYCRSDLVPDGWHSEGWFRNLNGRDRYLLFDAAPICNASGEMIAAIEVLQERTEQKLAKEALQESETRYRLLFMNSPHPKWIFDLETLAFLDVNEATVNLYGYSKEEFLSMNLKDIRPPEETPRLIKFLSNFSEVLGNAGTWIHRKKDGTIFNVEITFHIQTLFGKKVGVVLAQDVTERVKYEVALQHSEERYRQIVEGVRDLIFTVSTDGVLTSLNYAFVEITGWSRSDWIGKKFNLLVHPDDLPLAGSAFLACMQGDLFPSYELRIRTSSGDFVDLEAYSSPQYQDGQIICFQGIARDITQRKKAEKELRDSYNLMQKVFSSLNEAVFIVETGSRKILDCNVTAEKMFGFSRKEIIGVPTSILHASEEMSQRFSREMEKGYAEKGYFETLFVMKRKDNTVFDSEHFASPILDDSGNISSHVCVVRDISLQKQAEDEKRHLEIQLRQSQKMEALGTLAGGIAHDFNNILTAIISYCALIERRTPEGDQVQGYLKKLLASAERATELTRSLLAYSRKTPLNLQPVSLNNIIGNVQDLLSRLLGEDIEFSCSLPNIQLYILADPIQIEQVFMNLATNARDAMRPDGGILQIAIQDFILTRDFIKSNGFGEVGRYALATVSDTGCGMEKRTLERIFEPFYTTKDVGKGTGLGLSIVFGIIKQHNGFINVYSEPGKGSTFAIYLPLTDAKEELVKAEYHHQTGKGSETILLVEDDLESRSTLRELLEEEGYRVIEAADGEEGIERFREFRNEIGLIIMDVVMPKKNGKAAFEDIREIDPGARAIFISGYTSDILDAKGILHNGADFLFKPIAIADLLARMRQVLDK